MRRGPSLRRFTEVVFKSRGPTVKVIAGIADIGEHFHFYPRVSIKTKSSDALAIPNGYYTSQACLCVWAG